MRRRFEFIAQSRCPEAGQQVKVRAVDDELELDIRNAPLCADQCLYVSMAELLTTRLGGSLYPSYEVPSSS